MNNSKKNFLYFLFCGIFFYSGSFPAIAQVDEDITLKYRSIFISKNPNHIEKEEISILNALKISPKIFTLKLQARSGNASRFALYLHNLPVHEGYLVVLKERNGFAKILVPDFNFESATPLPIPESTATGLKEFFAFKQSSWKRVNAKTREIGNDIMNSSLDYYDEKEALVFSEDWLLKAGPDSIIKGSIFKPDPVSKYRMNYGGNLRDRSDTASSFLNAALDTVSIKVKFLNDTFSLENQWFKLGDYSLPNKPLAKRISPDFCFKRDNPFFEEVNIFYHLNQFRSFIDSIGFPELANYQLRIDAHGMDGADQSAYSPVQDVLAYGDGNVDDAEDAAVIVHEYCHALAHSAIPFGNTGSERKAIEEGLCDYLAGSYCKNLSNWQWENLFKWDGHNEFWAGRTLLSSKVYPVGLVGQIHSDGEIFSSALSNIELQIGRKKTHQILLNSLPFFIPNMKMRQAAGIMLKSDSTLFNGANNGSLSTSFTTRGIHPNQIIVSNGFMDKTAEYACMRIFHTGREITLKNISKDVGDAFFLDLNGRVLHKFSGLLSQQEVSISNKGIPNGFYLIQFIGSKSAEIHRFIITSD